MKNTRTIFAATTLAMICASTASGAAADKLSGKTPGDRIRCTFQLSSGGNSAVFDVTSTVDADGNVTFPKAGGRLDWVYYWNTTTGQLLSALDPTGDANLWDSIEIGDRFSLFGGSTGDFATIIATDLYIQNPSLSVGMSIMFSGGASAQLPGVMLLAGNMPYTGSASISGFNEVVAVPTPGAATLLALGGGLVALRRRREGR